MTLEEELAELKKVVEALDFLVKTEHWISHIPQNYRQVLRHLGTSSAIRVEMIESGELSES